MEGDPAARTLLFEIRSPHHYRPAAGMFVSFAAWHLLALGGALYTPIVNDAHRRFRTLFAISFGMVMVATVFTTAIFVPAVSQVFVWRLAPFSLMMAFVLLLTVAVPVCFDPQRNFAAAATTVTVALAVFADTALWLRVAVIAAVALAWGGRWFGRVFELSVRKQTRLLEMCGAAVAVGIMAFALGRGSLTVTPINPDEMALYGWAYSTDLSATFLVPPDLDNFRLNARRAIVVDWKSPPIDAPGIIEWYHRLELVSGVVGLKSRGEARDGFRKIDVERLRRLQSSFPIDYVVLRDADSVPGTGHEPVFANSRFTVFELGVPTEPGSTSQ